MALPPQQAGSQQQAGQRAAGFGHSGPGEIGAADGKRSVAGDRVVGFDILVGAGIETLAEDRGQWPVLGDMWGVPECVSHVGDIHPAAENHFEDAAGGVHRDVGGVAA